MTQERQTTRSTRVLILDEDRVEGGMLAFHLRREGLVVMLMTSAEEAADAIAWAEPDVLLVEVAAQGFDGREFLAQLAHLAVDVFAVADRQLPAEVELDALRLGVIDIMMKPIDPVTLARRLKTRPERKRRGSVSGLPEGGISGELAVHSVVHLLQMAHRHRLNARLHCEIAGDWAVALVRHGEVIDAEAPAAAGREAAFQMIRATQGAFVLFPLPGEAEELSRDDVIRADLATLVGDAMGRKEPRAVNVVKAREESFVLPHVGSPRGPLAKRSGNDDTLEYAAAAQAGLAKPGDAARVRRPGEREREAEDGRITVTDGGGVTGSATQTLHNAPSAQAFELMADARPQLRGEQGRPTTDPGVTLAANGATREPPPIPRRSPIESPTVDEGFDESTDQEELRLRRTGGAARAEGGARRASAPSMAAMAQGSGLRRVTGTGMAAARPATGRRLIEQEADGLDTAEERFNPRGAPRTAGPKWSLATMVMAGAVLVLALFIVVRLVSKDEAIPLEIGDDPSLKLGQALVDLEEGRRDAARAALAGMAASSEASSVVLATLARLHYQEGRLVESQALVERLVERNPSDPEALAWLGLIQAERKDGRAEDTFARALRGAHGELAERLNWLVPGKRGEVPERSGLQSPR